MIRPGTYALGTIRGLAVGRGRGGALVLMLGLALGLVASLLVPARVANGDVANDIPDGFVSGTTHVLRIRPSIWEAPPEPRLRSAAGTAIAKLGEAVVATCDLAAVTSTLGVLNTARVDDVPSACVVDPVHTTIARADRLYLGPSRLTGSDVASARVRATRASKKARPRFGIELALTDRGAATVAADPTMTGLNAVVDGTALRGTLSSAISQTTPGPTTTLQFTPDGQLSRADAYRIVDAIEQSRSEEVIGFAHQTTMTRDARALFGSNEPRIEDKRRFAQDCPVPDSPGTLVLGCQGADRIFLLRVDRPDLSQIMPVTAAHEMLHAAYARLAPPERRKINRRLDAAFASSTDPHLRDVIAEYGTIEPGARHNELHSLLGTEVVALGPALEQYYARYFEDRQQIVRAFQSYQSVFDALEAQYNQLSSEADALDAQLKDLEPQVQAAGAEADRLAGQIDSLRAQGRIDESNRLVDPQNAAVNRANSLADQFNGLVADYNSKVEALNALAITAHQIDEALGVDAPAP